MLLLILITLISLAMTFALIPWLIEGLREKGSISKDYYKYNITYIPNEGGIAILFACGLMVAFFPLIVYLTRRIMSMVDIGDFTTPYLLEINQFITLSILFFGIFGLMDDYLNVGRPLKVILPLIFTTPIILNVDPSFIYLPIFGYVDLQTQIVGAITLSILLRFIAIPIYIVVCSNLINMHSGFNGLATGTSSILLVFLLIKGLLTGSTGEIVSIGAITGAAIALWWYNKYPAQILEGNAAALMIGAAIGMVIVVKGFWIAGFVMLIPHTINFLLYLYWRVKHAQNPSDPRYKTVKFGKVRKDGTLEVPNQLTLKWVLPYRTKMTEKKAVNAMYLLTFIFCIIGLVIPW